VILDLPGSAAQTKTLTDCCASIFRAAPTCPCIARLSLVPSHGSSMKGRERPCSIRRRLRSSLNVLQRSVELATQSGHRARRLTLNGPGRYPQWSLMGAVDGGRSHLLRRPFPSDRSRQSSYRCTRGMSALNLQCSEVSNTAIMVCSFKQKNKKSYLTFFRQFALNGTWSLRRFFFARLWKAI
jgi:hypothetical protein